MQGHQAIGEGGSSGRWSDQKGQDLTSRTLYSSAPCFIPTVPHPTLLTKGNYRVREAVGWKEKSVTLAWDTAVQVKEGSRHCALGQLLHILPLWPDPL